MVTSSISATGGSYAAGGQTATRRPAAGALGKDEFMQLLVAQLRYQDPMRPMEDRDFAAQLAQFSALEQMAELARWQRLSFSMGLVGRQVTASVDGAEVTGTVAGIRLKDGRPLLLVGGREVELDQLRTAAPLQ